MKHGGEAMKAVFLSLAACFLFACSEDGGSSIQPTDLGQSISDSLPEPDISEPDLGVEDMASEDLVVAPCEAGEGCFGELCTSAEECLSGICTMHMGDKVCSRTCDESCPEGWSCTLAGAGGDAQYVCLSNYSHLCLPCETSEGCLGDKPNACV